MNFLDILGIKKAIIQAFEDVMVKFSFWISRMVYPMIADFYDIFDILARHRFFTDDTIKKISNNIYILISVIMLFAFSIKLITAIVNPDSLTDKKKGFTGLFMRSLIGILLIVFIPWGFQMAYELQDKLLNKSVIQKLILGDKAAYSSDGGDVIAGATLSTFLQPGEESLTTGSAIADELLDVDLYHEMFDTNNIDDRELGTFLDVSHSCPKDMTVAQLKKFISYYESDDESFLTDDEKKILENYSNAAIDLYDTKEEAFYYGCIDPFYSKYKDVVGEAGECNTIYETMIVNIDRIDNFKSCITKRSNGKYVYEYNGILGPIAGIFMAYEMLLLCIDIALRTIKLGLLELIAPVIICGYIYSGEIIKKWLKEVVATYVLVFVKLAVVSFLIVGMTTLPDFLNNSDFANHTLLIKLLIIIGLLQLVKQLPNLINSIFGIEIKSQGGIKGRLGEMAGVGKMAQDAWSKLGGKAKGLGKTLALAPVGAVGAGLKKGWKNLAQKDSLAGNFAAKVNQAMNDKTGRVLRTLKAGVNSNGKGTGKALTEAWNKDPITAIQRADEKTRIGREMFSKFNVDPTGTSTVYKPITHKGKKINLNSPFDSSNIYLKDSNGNEITFGPNNEKVNKNNIDAYIRTIKKIDGESDTDFNKRKKDIVDRLKTEIKEERRAYDIGKNNQLKEDKASFLKNYKDHSPTGGATIRKHLEQHDQALKANFDMEAAVSLQKNAISKVEKGIELTNDPKEKNKIQGIVGQMYGDGFYEKSLDSQIAILKSIESNYNPGEFDNIIKSMEQYNAKVKEHNVSAKGPGSLDKELKRTKENLEATTFALNEAKNKLKDDSDKDQLDYAMQTLSVKNSELAKNESDLVYFGEMDGYTGTYGQKSLYGDTLNNPNLISSSDTDAFINRPVVDNNPDIDTNSVINPMPEIQGNMSDISQNTISNSNVSSTFVNDNIINNNINNNIINNTSTDTSSSSVGGSSDSDSSSSSSRSSGQVSLDDMTRAVQDAIRAENSSQTDDSSDKLDSIQESIDNVHSTIRNNDIEINNSLENINRNITNSTTDIRSDIEKLKDDEE